MFQITEMAMCMRVGVYMRSSNDTFLGRKAQGGVRIGVYQGTRVAVKMMQFVVNSNYNCEVLEREMENISSVHHPNLVLFVGAITTGHLTVIEFLKVGVRKLLEEEKVKSFNIRPGHWQRCHINYSLSSFSSRSIIHQSISSVVPSKMAGVPN